MVSNIRVALLPIAVTAITSIITIATNLEVSRPDLAVFLNVAVLGLTYADTWLKAQESESKVSASASIVSSPPVPVGAVVTTSPAPGPTFMQGGVAVNVQLNAPQGTVQTVSGSAYTVGQAYNNAKSASGDSVPNGAVYVGSGGFCLNGNYFY